MRRKHVLALAILVGVCVLSGCVQVGVVGDSITAYSSPRIQETLNQNYTANLESFGGATIAQISGFVSDLQSQHLGISHWVVEAGTNDVGRTNNRNWKADYDALLAKLTGAKCIVLATVSVKVDYFRDPNARGATAENINDYIAAQAATHPNVRVLDWNAAVRSHPSLVGPDNIHPADPKGTQWWADNDKRALDGCPP